MNKNNQKGHSAFEQFHNPIFIESVNTCIQDFAAKYSLSNVALIETPIESENEPQILAGIIKKNSNIINDYSSIMEYLSKRKSKRFLSVPIPIFSQIHHYLVADLPSKSKRTNFETHFEILSQKLVNLLEYYTVTQLTMTLYNSINLESIIRLYVHEQQNHLSLLDVVFHRHRNLKQGFRQKDAYEMFNAIEHNITHSFDLLMGLRETINRSYHFVEVGNLVDNLLSIDNLLSKRHILRSSLPSYLKKYKICAIAQMILSTLLKNSRESLYEIKNRNPQISLKVSFNKKSHNIIFTHTDNGCGMSKKTKDLLFYPYLSTKSYGHGLGLFLSKRLVEFLGGKIDLIYSDPSRGTQFILSMPVKD